MSDKNNEVLKLNKNNKYGKINRKDCITVNGKITEIERGSAQHAEIDATHRMREDGSYFNDGRN